MNKFVKDGITEHKELVVRISKLESTIANWNPKDSTRSHVTYANLAILLASYKKAAEALECILENEGVTLGEDGCYREIVDKLSYPTNDNNEPKQPGNDYDYDVENNKK